MNKLPASSATPSQLFRHLRCWGALGLLALFATPLGAQTAPASANSTTPNSTGTDDVHWWNPANVETPPWFGLEYEHEFSASLKNGATGSMDSNTFQIAHEKGFDLNNDNHLTMAMAYTFINYNFSGVGTAPFGNVQKLGVNGHYTYDYNPDVQLFVDLSAQLAAATAGSFSNGGQISATVGPVWWAAPDLTIAVGPMFYTRMEDSDTWIPYVDVKWTPGDNWLINAYAGNSNGVKVSYDVFGNHATVVECSLDYNSHWFRAQNTPAGASAAVDETDTTLKLAVRQALSESVFVRGYIAGIFGSEYQFHVNGNSANSFDVGTTFGLGLGAGMSF
ncbi:MAG TPA: hypothetical protein VK737_04580 [Opitutales bacterium]|jgi:hypothetical protein|nr:hypothetical protein [Opitutales bacterium]